MLASIVLALFFLLFPALVLWLAEKRLALVDRIGPAVVCYAAGLALGNSGALPAGAAAVQDVVTTAAVPIALPLLFFSLDLRGWRRTGPRALLAFGLEVLSITVVSAAGFLLFRGALGAEAPKVAGMLVGVYTGGTINLAAIAAALKVAAPLFVAANASDIVVSGAYLLFLMTVGKRIIRRLLPHAAAAEAGAGATDRRSTPARPTPRFAVSASAGWRAGSPRPWPSRWRSRPPAPRSRCCCPASGARSPPSSP